MEREHGNVIIQYGDDVEVITKYKNEKKDPIFTSIIGNSKLKLTIVIDNVVTYFMNIYKVTVENKECDNLITIYSTVTSICSCIVLPDNKNMLINVNDKYW